MDVWLDDNRTPPNGDWQWVETVEDAIAVLQTGNVEYLSLDNDLGSYEREGWEVAEWMEENDVWPEIVGIHTSNPSAGRRMRQIIERSGLYGHRQRITYRSSSIGGDRLYAGDMYTRVR